MATGQRYSMIKLTDIKHTYAADAMYLGELYRVELHVDPGGHMEVDKVTPSVDDAGKRAIKCAVAEALRSNVYDAYW